MKLFCARIRQIRSVTIAAYKQELGMDAIRLEAHITSVDLMIVKICENGGKRGHRVDWETVDREALAIINVKEAVASKPGYETHPLAFYEYRNGKLDTNGKRADGALRVAE